MDWLTFAGSCHLVFGVGTAMHRVDVEGTFRRRPIRSEGEEEDEEEDGGCTLNQRTELGSIYTQGIHPVHTPMQHIILKTSSCTYMYTLSIWKTLCSIQGESKNWSMIQVHEREYLSCGGCKAIRKLPQVCDTGGATSHMEHCKLF